MKPSDAIIAIKEIVRYNLTQYEKGAKSDTFLIPFLVGDPGIGKTAIPKQVAAQIRVESGIDTFFYSDIIVAQYDAGELGGLVMFNDDKTRMVKLRPEYLPDIDNPDEHFGIFNFDELPQAFTSQQNIVSQMVNEYRVGQHRISYGVTLMATGNKPENKAGTNTIPTHLRDRLMFLNVEADHEDFLTWAAGHGIDPRVRAYIRNNPAKLAAFDAKMNANPSPRSWAKVSGILSMEVPAGIRRDEIAGTIGEGYGKEFETWIRVEDKMPKLADVLNKPNDVPVFGPKESDVLFMLLTSLADVATMENLDAIMTYVTRLPNTEFASFFIKDMITRDSTLINHKKVREWAMNDGMRSLA